MQLTEALVKQFEADQREHGTEVALFNLLWLKAADDLSAIGVRRVRTTADPVRRGDSRIRGQLPLSAFKRLNLKPGRSRA